jgi:hypothetical protein
VTHCSIQDHHIETGVDTSPDGNSELSFPRGNQKIHLFPYGNPCMEAGIEGPPFPYGGYPVTNPFPYGVSDHLGI